MTSGSRWEGGKRGAVRYTVAYALRLVAMAALVLALVLYVLYMFRSSYPDSLPGMGGLADTAVRYVLPFLPLLALAVPTGYYPSGTRSRLAWRLVLNAYLVVAVLVTTGGMRYVFDDFVADASTGSVLSGLTVSLDISVVSALMMLIPVCSVLDAVLEYREWRRCGINRPTGPHACFYGAILIARRGVHSWNRVSSTRSRRS